jgi:hypothetical protein
MSKYEAFMNAWNELESNFEDLNGIFNRNTGVKMSDLMVNPFSPINYLKFKIIYFLC